MRSKTSLLRIRITFSIISLVESPNCCSAQDSLEAMLLSKSTSDGAREENIINQNIMNCFYNTMMKIPLTFVVQFLSVFTSFSCLFKISSIKDVCMKTTRQFMITKVWRKTSKKSCRQQTCIDRCLSVRCIT